MSEEKKQEQFFEKSYTATPILSEHAYELIQDDVEISQSFYMFPHHMPGMWIKMKKILQKIIDMENLTIDQLTSMIEEIYVMHFNSKQIRSHISFKNLSEALRSLDEKEDFLKNTVKKLARLAMEIENSELVELGADFQVLSKKQALICLASMFFCTLHKQFVDDQLPKDFIMAKLFQEHKYDGLKLEKIKCILFYFKAALSKDLDGEIRILRRSHPGDSYNELCELIYMQYDRMEEFSDYYIVDFANKKIGGGVLGYGSVQEEILFLIHPELIVLLLFTPQLQDNEALIVEGVTRYIDYDGYAENFKFANLNKEQKTLKFICIDAVNYSEQKSSQYDSYQREILKARVGFSKCEKICTGKWGCGVFQGDWQLKLVIQWIAASKSGCQELLFINNDDQFVYNQVFSKIENLAQLENILINFCQLKEKKDITCGILEYIVILDDFSQLY
ncbi:hypothetical protein pb186bvf_007040 [Paramecium bursaria]